MACEDSGEEGDACSQCRAQGVDHLDKKGWGGVGWGVECIEIVRGDSTSCTPEEDSLTRDREGGAIGAVGYIQLWCAWLVLTH